MFNIKEMCLVLIRYYGKDVVGTFMYYRKDMCPVLIIYYGKDMCLVLISYNGKDMCHVLIMYYERHVSGNHQAFSKGCVSGTTTLIVSSSESGIRSQKGEASRYILARILENLLV